MAEMSFLSKTLIQLDSITVINSISDLYVVFIFVKDLN